MQYIQLPDGTTAEFPDDISDEEIEAVLQREYPSEIEPTEQIPVGETPEAQMLAQAVEPEEEGHWEGWIKPTIKEVGRQAKAPLYGLMKGAQHSMEFFDNAATLISRATGWEKGGLFEKLAEMGEPPGDYTPETFAEEVVAGLAEAVPEIGMITALPGPAVVTMGYMGAIRGGVKGAKEAVREGVKGALLGATLHGAAYLPKAAQIPALAGIFGGQAALEGAEPREVAKATAIGAGLGLAGGRKRAPELKKVYPKEFEKFMTEERARQLEEEFAEIKPKPKEELPAKLIEELRKTEALEVEPELWRAVEPTERPEVLYKRRGRIVKEEPKKVEIEGEPEAVKIPIREEAPTIDITKRKGVIFPKEKPEEVLRAKLEEKPPVKGKVEPKAVSLPTGWKAEVGKTRIKEGHTYESEVDWQNKRIVFSKQKHMDNPEIFNHEVAHVLIETLPEAKQKLLLDKYVDLKNYDDPQWIVKNHFHREEIAMDYGNYLSNKTIPNEIKNLFEKHLPKTPELGKVKAPPIKLMPETRQGMYANVILQDKAGKIYEGNVSEHMKLATHFRLRPEDISKYGIIEKEGRIYKWKEGTPSNVKQWNDILRMQRRGEPEVTLDTLGLQTSYEVGTKWLKAVKEGRTEKVRQATEQARKEFLTPVEGNPLDKGAIAFLKSEKFRDYIKAMPTIGELKPSEIFKYDPAAKKLIATIETKGGKLKPAIRQSGYHALKDFADSFEGVKDVSKLSATWTDPTRFIQELDQGRWGGMAQKHILWPMRSTTLAKLRWSDMRKASLANIQEKYNAGSGRKADAIGDVIEYISTERLRVPAEQFLRIPEVAKALKRFKPKVKIELIDGAKEIRTFFNDLLKAQNIARGSRKQKLIDYRQVYRPWVMERNIWHKLLGMKQKPETIMERPEMPDFIFPDKPPNPRALAREGGLAGYPKVRNIFRLAADYIDTAGRDIFDTNVVHHNKIHSAVLRGKGLENAAEGINRVTAEVYAGVAPRITRAAVETLPKPLHKGMLKIRRMLTRAVFPLNWTWNMFIQTSSAGITYARYGNRANLAGLRYFLDPKMKNAVQTNAYSYILKSRWGGRAHYQDIQNSITRNKRLEAKPIEKVEDLFNYMTSTFENGLTGHAITAARHHGRTKLGLKGRELWEYASEGGAKTQSMYNYADLPGLLRAREVGAVTPFQTFSFEVFNTVREMNIPGLRKVIGKTGLYETMSANSVAGKALLSNRMKMLARWAVAIAITDVVGEKAIGRKPWVVSSFIPFVGYIVGGYAGRGPVPHQYIQDAKKGIKDVLVNEDFGRLRKWLLRYHVLAGVQLNRMLDGIEVVAKGGRVEDIRGRLLYKVSPEDYLKGILMGPYRTEAGKEYGRKRRKSKSLLEQLKKKQGRSTTID